MKKGIILATASLCVGISLNAQQWAGSATTTGNISRTGNVGVGTASPAAPIHVENGGNVLYRNLGVGQLLRGVQGSSSAGLIIEEGANSNSSAISMWDNNLYFFRKSGAGSYTSSDIKMTLDANGSLGVGTSGSFAYTSLTGALLGSTVPPSSGTVKFEVNGVSRCLAEIVTSDRNLKANIQSIPNALEIVKHLDGKTYVWNDKAQREKGADNGLHIGFIAQELQKVIPEIVIADKDGELGVNYNEIIPILTEAVKAQQTQIEELKALVNNLVNSNARGSINKSMVSSAINVALSDNNITVLGQNAPNPFNDQTTISFNIPNDVKSAKILFSTTDGKTLKSIDITQRGKGVVNVYANELKSGIYMYTLVLDGRAVESKRMEVLK